MTPKRQDMAAGTFWAGLDLGETRTSICVVDDDGNIVLETECDSTATNIVSLLEPYATHIGLVAAESGTGTYLVRKLRAAGLPTAIFESRKASRFLGIRRNKSDRSDAKGIADLARLGRNTVSQVHLKSLENQQLRSELLMRHKLVRLRVAVEASMRSRLVQYGRVLPKSHSPDALRKNVEAEVSSLRTEEGIDLSAHLDPLLGVAESLRRYERKLDREFAARAKRDPICQLLMEVPGVGPICALAFTSAVEDPHRFADATNVGAYLGLIPRRYQSGEVSRTLGITKTGNRLTRTLLVSAATVMLARKADCELQQWASTLKDRLGSQRAKVALARKLAVVMLSMWKEGEHFRPYPPRQFSPKPQQAHKIASPAQALISGVKPS
jgi:transposase